MILKLTVCVDSLILIATYDESLSIQHFKDTTKTFWQIDILDSKKVGLLNFDSTIIKKWFKRISFYFVNFLFNISHLLTHMIDY